MGSERGNTGNVLLGIVLVVAGAAIGAGIVTVATTGPADSSGNETGTPGTNVAWDGVLPGGTSQNETVVQFESEQDYTAYLQRGQRLAQQGTTFTGGTFGRPDIVLDRPVMTAQPTRTAQPVADSAQREFAVEAGGDGGSGAAPQPDRVSSTNVQEAGLDEPDILKTDGTHVYYAPKPTGRQYWNRDEVDRVTHIIGATPPEQPTRVASIERSGRLLRTGDQLVVIEDDELVGYDVSDPENPEQTWEKPLDDSVVTARLYDGSVYLVTRSDVSLDDPCPIRPMGEAVTIPCTDVYHPRQQAPVDATYTALSVDPASGDVQDTTSFVGTNDQTSVYMSEHGLYVTYTQQADRGKLRINFLLDEQQDRLPSWVETRLTEIRDYNISTQAKRQEADRILQQWYRTLGDDERQTVQTEIHDAYRSYLADNQRDLVQTGIVQVGIGDGDLAVENVGSVPGEPLNQFSLDEHDGTLRITTTIPEAGSNQSRNDLYVLDGETLDRRGAVQDMGENERVYSVRYVDDTAYVVTFRRIDPFHVVDLSNSDDPELVGELKLPGFSSYLHPVDEDHVLGIGEEDGEVKAVLFDVSDPSDPAVADDYLLDSRWSAIVDSHHAFLLDRDHGVFFLPTGDGGMILDYTDGDLSLRTAVDTDGPAYRAMYVDDVMYVFGSDEFAVIDETTWTRTDTVHLD